MLGYAYMKGDHIFILRAGYTHHGIDMGDGTVVHWALPEASEKSLLDKHQASILRTPLKDFQGNSKLKVKKYKDSLPAEKVVERALERLGENGYHLVFNNCEQFASFCKTGISESLQSEFWRTKLASIPAQWILNRALKKWVKKGMIKKIITWLWVADLAELAIEVHGLRHNQDTRKTARASALTGFVLSAGIGALMAGPLGACAGTGVWALGNRTEKMLKKVFYGA